MSNNDQTDSYRRAIEIYGHEAQIMMCVEEMAELTVELLHFLRGRPSNVLEEIADVTVMLEQMKILFEAEHDGTVQKIVDHKLKRLRTSLNDKGHMTMATQPQEQTQQATHCYGTATLIQFLDPGDNDIWVIVENCDELLGYHIFQAGDFVRISNDQSEDFVRISKIEWNGPSARLFIDGDSLIHHEYRPDNAVVSPVR